mmetsp:Transcript_31952/g.32577  ORF Transcript_31952/g.32577 Transcript_31952/m.32577 type:complete len:151 (+) Transcript_31952:134-586(+)|eukprot:CAMPEP_0182416620 /NCGR_PEP_ID=MMETSP1167-20130531/981_1 /TAXON_ID=2988 /ORGANISM="Mallomonas Sp, Strain CCMP3275" /LENGTH=150 /DNA_ID=CAMNT_0024589563 /DNA_START=135 /DNA_END=587 /DNA_ORIENTATION=-
MLPQANSASENVYDDPHSNAYPVQESPILNYHTPPLVVVDAEPIATSQYDNSGSNIQGQDVPIPVPVPVLHEVSIAPGDRYRYAQRYQIAGLNNVNQRRWFLAILGVTVIVIVTLFFVLGREPSGEKAGKGESTGDGNGDEMRGDITSHS